MRAEGIKAGAPDLIIFDRPPSKREAKEACPGVAIELKRIKGGRVSDEQRQWLDNLSARGWITAVCKGFEEAVKLLEELGYGEKQ